MTTKCFVDLGCGDGEKTIIPVQYALESGRYGLVSAALVDCSQDMLHTAEETLLRLNKYMPDKFRVRQFHERFEELKDDEAFKRFIREHGEREWLFYGSTAGNFDPPVVLGILYDNMLPGDPAQVGLHIYTEGHDDAVLKAYEGDAARDVAFVGLRELGFTKDDKKTMEYLAELTKREYPEFADFNLGPLTAVKTFFRAPEPMERGLITLSKGDSLQATLSIKYREDQARKVFEHEGKFQILEIYKSGDIALLRMRKEGA